MANKLISLMACLGLCLSSQPSKGEFFCGDAYNECIKAIKICRREKTCPAKKQEICSHFKKMGITATVTQGQVTTAFSQCVAIWDTVNDPKTSFLNFCYTLRNIMEQEKACIRGQARN